MSRIASFTGDHRFLSNFYPFPVEMDGASYPTVEHAFQAAKTFDVRDRERIRAADTPGRAKRIGRSVELRADWEDVKLDVMKGLLHAKFAEKNMRGLLLRTGDAELVEGNHWGDRYWGQDPVGRGENHLGRLLMEVRAELALRFPRR